MSLTQKGVSADFNDENDTYFEIDAESLSEIPGETRKKSEPTDPFAKLAIDSLDRDTKRKANSLQKRMQNESGTLGSKYIDPYFINGYTLWDLVPPPYDLDALAQIFEENPTHNAAVSAKANNVVGLGYEWQQSRTTKTKLQKAKNNPDKIERIVQKVQEEMERMDEIFEAFHEEETYTETWTKAVMDMYSVGNGYIEIGRRNDGKIGYCGHIPATQIRVRRLRDGFIQQVWVAQKPQAVFFRNFGDMETPDPTYNKDPKPNELIHLKVYSPKDAFYGVPNIVSALSSIVGDKFAKEYNIDYFENKAIPRYAIIIKGAKLSEKAKKEVIQYFRNEVKGKNHGTLVVPLPATMGNTVDVKFEKLEIGIQDGSFEKYRKSNRDDIVSAHRVPPTKVGIYENANLSTSRDADKTFKEQVCGPEQERIEKRNNKIVKEFTDIIELRFKKLDIIDADMKSRIHDRYLRTEILTPNEVRDEIGRPAIEDGDKVHPYTTKVQQEKLGQDAEQAQLNREHQVTMANLNHKNNMENAKEQTKQAQALAQAGPAGNAGAPPGNTNNPAKSGPNTPKDQTGTRNERGQSQDEKGVRERK